ncbi:MAG: outer membrane protein assembly factor BamE [Legionella sp.]
MRIRTILINVALICSLTNCVSLDHKNRAVQQGNLLPKEKIERLKHGLTKEDVATLMGTSMMPPLFNNDRWDYVYTWRKGNNPLRIKHISLYFEQNRLAKIEQKP